MGYGKTYKTQWLEDLSGNQGTANQVLISTSTGIAWATASGTGIIGGPYLPLAGGTLTGNLNINTSTNFPLLITGTDTNYTAIGIRNTNGGDAGIYMDGINGDFGGSDYAFIGQKDEGYLLYNIGASSPLPYHVFTGGNVGIGMTDPAANLHVESTNDGMTNGINTNQLKLSYGASVNGAGSSIAFGVSAVSNFTGAKIVHERKGSNSVGDLSFWTRSTGGINTDYDLTVERMRISSLGNVGIGTTSPDYLLDLYKSTDTTSSSTGTTLQRLWNYVGSDLNQQKTFVDFVFQDDNNNEYPQVRIGAEVGQNGNSDTQQKEGSGAFVVYTNNATGDGPGTPTGLAERFRVDYSGNVGIGTTDPASKLTISASNSGAANNNTLRFVDTDVTTQANQSFGKIEFETSDTNNPGVNAFINAFAEGTGGTGALSFGTGSGGSTEKMRITSGGNVGIGTTSPSEKLEVSGTTFINGQIYGGFGAVTTSGTLDWNDSTNARSGSGYTLLRGNATNGPAGTEYYHPFSWEYSSYDNDGNMTQFAIPYSTNNTGMYFRNRYSGSWSSWAEIVTTTKTLPGGPYLPLAGGTMTLATSPLILPGEESNQFKIAFTGASASSGLSTVDQSGAGLYIGANSRVNNSGVVVYHDSALPSSGIYFDGWDGDDMEFYTGSSGNPTKRLTLSAGGDAIFTGNVGIGTTSPGDKLTVQDGTITSTDSSGTNYAKLDRFSGLTLKGNGAGTRGVQTPNTDALTLGTNNTERMRITSTGNVGIGTTSPVAAFEVQTVDSNRYVRFKASNGEERFQFYTGGTGNPAAQYMYTADGATRTVQIHAGGSSYFNAGNVGIGTTSPVAKLEVTASSGQEGIIINNSNGIQTFQLGHLTSNDSYFQMKNNSDVTEVLFRTDNGNSYINTGNVGIGTTSPTAPLTFGKSVYGGFDSENFYRIKLQDQGGTLNDVGIGQTASGNMGFNITSGNAFIFNNGTSGEIARFNGTGLGIGTTSPSSKLQVDGTVRINSNSLIFDGASPVMTVNSSNNASGFRLNVTGLGSGGDTMFRVQESGTTEFVIRADGRVGMGVDIPAEKLEVDGNVKADSFIKDGGTSSQYLMADGSVSTSGGTIGGSIANQQIAFGATTANEIAGSSTFTYSDSGGIESLSLGDATSGQQTNFNLSHPNIGGTRVRYNLYAGNNLRGYLQSSNTAGEVTLLSNANLVLDCGSTDDITMASASGSSVGIGNTSPSYKLDVTGTGRFTSTVTATNFILSSDERLKENIKDLEPKHIDPNWKSFNIKDSNEGYRVGVIAQELEVNHPEFVETDVDGYKSVKYIDLLISKIAELEERIKKLEK